MANAAIWLFEQDKRLKRRSSDTARFICMLAYRYKPAVVKDATRGTGQPPL